MHYESEICVLRRRREYSFSINKNIHDIGNACSRANIIFLLLPDELLPEIYEKEIKEQ